MKRNILIAILCSVFICAVIAFSACNNGHEHTWDNGEITSPATCSTTGVKTYTCTDCGKTKTETTPKTDHPHEDGWLKNDNEHWHPASCEHTTERVGVSAHEWDNGTVVTAATCIKTGLMRYSCVCGQTKTGTIEKTGHAYSSEWSKDGDNHWHACTTAGCTAISDEHAHNWNDGEDTTLATCSTTGVKTYTCTDCGKTKTETTPKTDHPHEDGWLKNDDEHWQVATCEHKNERVNVGAHEWDEGTVVTAANCQKTGLMRYACICGLTKTQTIEKTGHAYSSEWSKDETNHWHACTAAGCTQISDEHAHNWNSGEITTPSTCIAEGIKTYTCTDCAKTKTEPVPFAQHNYSNEWSKDETNHWHACTTAGCTQISGEHAHNWNGGEITTPSTCIEQGVKTYTCADCAKTKTEPVPFAPHSYSGKLYSDDDWHWQICAQEGCGQKSTVIEHSYGEWQPAGQMMKICSVCEYEYDAPSLAGSSSKVTVTVGGGEVGGVTVFTRGIDYYYTFTYTGSTAVTVWYGYNTYDYDKRENILNEGEYTLSSSGQTAFTLKLPDRSAAYLKVSSAEETAFECEISMSVSATMPNHTHSFSTEWSTSESHHWHACTGCDEETDVAFHDFAGNACTVCGYPQPS